MDINSIMDYETALEDVLDDQFPKGECQERGGALVLYSMAVLFAKKLDKR